MASRNIRILGRNFRVTSIEDEQRAGYCDRAKGLINVTPDQDEFSRRDTLLHECMHGILHQQGSSHAYKLEESFVRPLATGLMTLFQDNPALARELFAPIRKAK